VPRDSPALKGREEPLDLAEAPVRGGPRLVISALQGLLPEKDGLCFETQAVGLGFVSSPLWGSARHPLPKGEGLRIMGGVLIQY